MRQRLEEAPGRARLTTADLSYIKTSLLSSVGNCKTLQCNVLLVPFCNRRQTDIYNIAKSCRCISWCIWLSLS